MKVGAITALVGGLAWAGADYLSIDAADPGAAIAMLLLMLLSFVGAVTGYVTLSLWMMRVRDIVKPQGYPAPAGWQIWAGWFIPFYSLIAPVKVMNDLSYKAGKERHTPFLALWWAGWLVFAIGNNITGIETLDRAVLGLVSTVMAVAVLVSFAGLWVLIPRISRAAAAPAPQAA